MGHCPTLGAAAMSRPRAKALTGAPPPGRAGPLPQVGGTHRYAASITAACKSERGPSSVPGILSPRKIIGTYRKDGPKRRAAQPWLSLKHDMEQYCSRNYYSDGRFSWRRIRRPTIHKP